MPSYSSSPSVCPLQDRNSKAKKRRKVKIGIDVPYGMSKWNANFSSKGQRSRSQDVKPPKSGVVLTNGLDRAAGADCRLGLRHC